jgi:hypothetical protein
MLSTMGISDGDGRGWAMKACLSEKCQLAQSSLGADVFLLVMVLCLDGYSASDSQYRTIYLRMRSATRDIRVASI